MNVQNWRPEYCAVMWSEKNTTNDIEESWMLRSMLNSSNGMKRISKLCHRIHPSSTIANIFLKTEKMRKIQRKIQKNWFISLHHHTTEKKKPKLNFIFTRISNVQFDSKQTAWNASIWWFWRVRYQYADSILLVHTTTSSDCSLSLCKSHLPFQFLGAVN